MNRDVPVRTLFQPQPGDEDLEEIACPVGVALVEEVAVEVALGQSSKTLKKTCEGM